MVYSVKINFRQSFLGEIQVDWLLLEKANMQSKRSRIDSLLGLGAFLPKRSFWILAIGLPTAFYTGCNRVFPSTSSSAQESTPPIASVAEPPQSPKQDSAKRTLSVEIDGFSDRKGRCRVALYRDAEGFNQPEKAWIKETLELPSTGPLRWTIQLDAEDLKEPRSLWAVSAHHDKNGNDKLDKNAFGIPTEPYGFSNNPKRGFGPPKFDEVSFSIDAKVTDTPKRIEIKIQ